MTVAAEGAAQVLHLDAGSVELHVEKLTSAQRFLVDTPDSEVEVRGTRFSVSVVPPDAACGAGVRTRVAVTEGVVVVRHAGLEDRVALGESWPAGCLRVAGAATAGVRATGGGPIQAGPSNASTLADQNDSLLRRQRPPSGAATPGPRSPCSIVSSPPIRRVRSSRAPSSSA